MFLRCIFVILIFSILFYPIFFIISYVAGEYIYPTRNGAMLFAFCCAFIFSFLYYTIRKRVSQLREKKLNKKRSIEATLTALMLVDKNDFQSVFPKNSLSDNSYSGVNEEKLLEHLRKNEGEVHIYSIKGITDGAEDFLKLLKRKYFIHSADEIIEKTKNLDFTEIETKSESKFKKFKKALLSSEFKKFALKYGVILLLLSLITPYKFYYILFGSLLIIYSLTFRIIKKINLRNRIPYPRS